MNVLKLFKKNKLPAVLFFLITVTNLTLFFVPLIGKLGYEHAALNSFLIFIFTGLLAVSYFRNNKDDENHPENYFIRNKIILSAILFIPFITGFVSTIFFSTCPFSSGIIFYVVIALPAVIIGPAAAYFSYFVSRKFAYVIFVLVTFLLIFSSLWEFYFYPQIYFYNPLVGFLPGTIYDEDLKVELLLVMYRIIELCVGFLILFSLKRLIYKEAHVKFFAVIIIIVISSGFFLLKPVFSLATNIERLTDNLNNRITTEHFEINFSSPDNSISDISRIGLLHEYYYEQIVQELGIRNSQKIISFIFKNSGQKRKLFGSGNADVAKPWSNQIFLNYDSFEKSLKHELVHVLSGNFGTTIFKISDDFNSAMVEGIAMAIENDFDGYRLHYAAKLAYRSGSKIKISQLFSGLNFFSQYSTVAYLYAGSFVRFLVDVYGIEKVKKIYGDYDFKKILNKDIGALEKEYFKFLDSVKINFNKNQAQLYFGGQPIFKKHCPRIAASQTNKASEYYKQRNYSEAKKIFADIYSYSGSFSSLSGLINSMIKLKEYSSAGNILKKEIKKFEKTRYYFTLEVLLGEVYLWNDKPAEANVVFDSVLVQNPHFVYANNILIKREFLKQGIGTLKKYLSAETKERFEMLFRLNSDSVRSFSIPTLINASSDTSQVIAVCSYFRDKIDANDFYSSYALFALSEVSESIGNYLLAKEYAVKALNYTNDENYLKTLTENLKRINWLNNFSEELKPFFVYQ